MILDALGEAAARVAGRIAGDATILACEPAFAAEALTRALALRRAGTAFVLSIHVEDQRDVRTRAHALTFATTYASWDETRLMLDNVEAETASAQPELADALKTALIETIRLSASVAVRSWSEYERLVTLIGTVPRAVDIVINDDPDVPAPLRGAATDVVVYAPQSRGAELAPYVAALGDLGVPVTMIALDAPPVASAVRFVTPDGAAEALGRARVIVDGTRNDPGAARALAAHGRPLVIPATSGAHELLRDAPRFESWRRRSILTAVADALSMDPPVLRTNGERDRPQLRAPRTFGAGAPLVTIVVTTHNRPALLAETLATIERQTYPNLEIVVVNDAGSDVSDVVARFSRARLLEQPENRGPAAARNRGLADARGEFVQLFDDDDEMFPDHVATLAHALIESGLDVAYGQMINAIVTATPAGSYDVESLAGYTALMDHADIQWAGSIATTALMFRRDVIGRIGGVDERMEAAEDYEFWLRLADGREWARAGDVTSLYFIRKDGSNRSNSRRRRYANAHRAIYQLHPSSRPLVEAGRAAMLEYFDGFPPPG